MITIKIEGVKELEAALNGDAKKISRQLSAAINKTAKKLVLESSKEIRKEMAAKAKEVKSAIEIKPKSNAKTLMARMVISPSRRISVGAFRTNQTRAGVSYKPSPRRGRTLIRDAFMGPRPGIINPKFQGHVIKRRGQARKPTVMAKAASPWGVFVKNKIDVTVIRIGNAVLQKEVREQVRLAGLRRRGIVK